MHLGTHFYAPRLWSRLQGMLEAPTTIVEAPAGYGKTTAVRDALEREVGHGGPVRWFSAGARPAREAWTWLCAALEDVDAGVGKRLSDMGYRTQEQTLKTAYLLRGLRCAQDTYLVIDNLDLLLPELPHEVLEAMLGHGGEKLHLILIAQRLPRSSHPSVGRPIHAITAADLTMSEQDVADCFEAQGVAASPGQMEELYRMSEGLPLAVHAQLQRALRGQGFSLPPEVPAFFERVVWAGCSVAEQELLLALAPLPGAGAGQLCAALGVQDLPPFAAQVLSPLRHIRYDREEGVYRPHPALRALLQDKLHAVDAVRSRICLRSGRWLAQQERIHDALECYHMTAAYDEMIALPLTHLLLSRIGGAPAHEALLRLEAGVSDKAAIAHPLGLLQAAYQLLAAGCQEGYNRLMQRARWAIEGAPRPVEEQRRLLGEWKLVSAFSALPDIGRMAELFEEVAQMLHGPSRVILPSEPLFFGCPSLWFLFHRAAGQADACLAAFRRAMPVYRALTGGHGAGAEEALEGELYEMRGDFAQAQVCAHRAMYLAKEGAQTTVRLCAALLLGRIGVSTADPLALHRALSEMRAAQQDAPPQAAASARMSADLARALLFTMLEEPERAAQWTRDGRWKDGLTPVFRLLVYPCHGAYLIKHGQSATLLGALEAEDEKGVFREHVVAAHYAYLGMAVAYLMMGMAGKAAQALARSLSVSEQDGMYSTYLRFVLPLRALLALPMFHEHRRFIEEIARVRAAGETMEKQTSFGGSEEKQTEVGPLTGRELEVGILAARGLRNREIAKQLHLSENTVKTHLKTIFQKLMIDRRSALLDRLQELEKNHPFV